MELRLDSANRQLLAGYEMNIARGEISIDRCQQRETQLR